MDGMRKMLKAKPCYGHLGGTLGNRMFSQLLTLGWFEENLENARTFNITPKGKEELENLGVDIYYKK
jgi:hypothetical protein